MQVETAPKGFYVASWGVWGWAETAVKAVGIVIGIIAFFTTSAVSALTIGGNPELGAIIVLALFTLVSLVIIGLRFQQREIVSIGYAIANFLGHAGMLIALLRVIDSPVLPIAFGIAYVAGELVKQRFLVVSGFTEAGQTTASMVMVSRVLMAIYILFVVFILI